MTKRTKAGRAGVAPSLDGIEVCANNPHGPRHQWHRDGTRTDRNGRTYWVYGCQLCGYTVYIRNDVEVRYGRD